MERRKLALSYGLATSRGRAHSREQPALSLWPWILSENIRGHGGGRYIKLAPAELKGSVLVPVSPLGSRRPFPLFWKVFCAFCSPWVLSTPTCVFTPTCRACGSFSPSQSFEFLLSYLRSTGYSLKRPISTCSLWAGI